MIFQPINSYLYTSKFLGQLEKTLDFGCSKVFKTIRVFLVIAVPVVTFGLVIFICYAVAQHFSCLCLRDFKAAGEWNTLS